MNSQFFGKKNVSYNNPFTGIFFADTYWCAMQAAICCSYNNKNKFKPTFLKPFVWFKPTILT